MTSAFASINLVSDCQGGEERTRIQKSQSHTEVKAHTFMVANPQLEAGDPLVWRGSAF